jgi:hypothetical protein
MRRIESRKRFLSLLLCSAVLLLVAVPGGAQTRDWNQDEDPLFEGLGVHLGMTGGFGLAYKFPIKWWLLGQVSGGIWNNDGDNRHNVGAELQYILRQSGRDRLYLGASMGHFYHKQDGRTMDHVNLGFGVGLERLWQDRVGVQLELTFTNRGDDDSVMIFPQAGVFYYF